MNKVNGSFVTEFILLGLTDNPHLKIFVFMIFLFIYLFTIGGNIILITVCICESRLHTPMYFFIGNLSFLDIFYCSVFVPNMLHHMFMDKWNVSFSGCAAQIVTYVVLSFTESVLLTIMAYDRYVAICTPLHYPNIMNSSSCTKMVVGSWVNGLLLPIPAIVITLRLPLCGHNVINHFFCDGISLIKIACVETFIAKTVIFASGIIILLIPLAVIFTFYARIIVAIMRISSTDGKKKAFSTCSAHLINIFLIYVAAIFLYMKPAHKVSDSQDKTMSVFYTVGPPLWNPIIYSLRNKEIKMAVHNLMRR